MPTAKKHRPATWRSEATAQVIILLCFVFLVSLLRYYDGRDPPHWRLGFKVQSVATIFARLLEAALFKSNFSAMFQLAVLRFIVPRPLKEMEIFAGAARSIRRSPALIRLGGWATMMALASILRPIITTNTQNAITERAVLVEAGQRPIPICERLATAPTDPQSQFQKINNDMIGALWVGTMGKGGTAVSINVECLGADECSWSKYSTIAMDYRCKDVSKSIVRQCESGSLTDCTLTSPTTGLALQESEQRYVSQAYMPPQFDVDIHYPFEQWEIIAVPEATRNETIVAVQCSIFPVVKMYTASFVNGTFSESLLSTYYNHTQPQSNNTDMGEWLMIPDGEINGTFSISQDLDVIPIQERGLTFFTGTGNFSNNHTDFGDQDQHQRFYSSLLDGTYPQTIGNIVEAGSTAMRLSRPYNSLYNSPIVPATQAFGQAFRYEQRFYIQWYWFIPSAIAWLISLMNLVFVIVQTKRFGVGISKGNVLDLMNRAPSEKSRDTMEKRTSSRDHRAVAAWYFQSSRDGDEERFRFVEEGYEEPGKEDT